MSTTISETIRKTNKHLIRESFLFTRDPSKGAGGPQIGASNFLHFLFFLFYCVFSRTADLSGLPFNPSGPPFGPPLACGHVKD